MKKIIFASFLALSSLNTFAAPAPQIDPTFTKVQQLIQAKDMTGAYQELDRLAKAGNAQAMYNQAYLTQLGQGTQPNDKKALQLFEDSAKKGYSMANFALAKNYATGGLGLKVDEKKSREYLEKAAEQGFDEATIELAVLLFSENNDASDKKGLAKLAPLIQKGQPQAIHAKALYDISSGIKHKNENTIKQGLASIQELAKKGYIPALMAIANMFVNGDIIAQNLPEAKKIYSALAKENQPQAKENLAVVNKMIAEQAKGSKKK